MSTLPEDNTAQAGSNVAAQAAEAGVLSQLEHFVEGLVHPGTQAATEQPEIPTLTDAAKTEAEKDEPTSNSGAALAEQAEEFRKSFAGKPQAGNAMDTMHGAVNSTWPPKLKGA